MPRISAQLSTLALLPLVVCAATSIGAQTGSQSRERVPDDKQVAAAKAKIDEIFQVSSAKTSAQRRQLFARLLETAAETKETVSHFALLQVARDLAVEGSLPEETLTAIKQLAARYEIDAWQQRVDAFEQFNISSRQTKENRELLAHLRVLIRQANADEAFDAAEQLAVQALQVARSKLSDIATVKELVAERKTLAEAKQQYVTFLAARKILQTAPDDPEANAAAGRYTCFRRGHWAAGLSMLALGADKHFKTLAVLELSKPTKLADQLKLADGWYDAAQQQPAGARDHLLTRAASWYARAAKAELSSLQQIKVDQRLKELADHIVEEPVVEVAVAAKPAPTKIDLLSLIDPAKHAVSGEWKLKDKLLVSPTEHNVRIRIPHKITGDYRVTVVAERIEGKDSFAIGLVGNGSQFCALFDGFEGKYSGLHMINGLGCDENETTYTKPIFAPSKKTTLSVTVRQDRIEVAHDGKTIVDWTGDQKSLSLWKGWAVPHRDELFVGGSHAVYHIHSITVEPVTDALPGAIPAARKTPE